MAKHYCSVHGEHKDDDGCPACREAETHAEEASRELLESLNDISEQSAKSAQASAEAARHAAYLANNPGDYECPACKMTSLKPDASRCPMCQSDVPDGFWEQVQERERLAEQQRRQAEERRQKWLASPEYAKEQERSRLAVKAAERAERAVVSKANFKFLCTAALVVIVFPVLALNMGVHPWIVITVVLAIIATFLLGVVSGIIVSGVLAIIGIWIFS